MSKLRVWWNPQIGADIPQFTVEVKTVRQGVLIMDALAQYDLYQFNNKIKPDYSNMGGLEVLESSGEWEEWYDSMADTDDPREFIEMIDNGELPVDVDLQSPAFPGIG